MNTRNHVAYLARKPLDFLTDFQKLIENGEFSEYSENEAVFYFSAAIGQCLRFDIEIKSVALPGEKQISDMPTYLKDLDISGKYSELLIRSEQSDTPLPETDAVELLAVRELAELSFLGIRRKIHFPGNLNIDFHKKLTSLHTDWMETEDRLIQHAPWIFIEAVPWLIERMGQMGAKLDRTYFPWFYEIPKALSEAWELPIPMLPDDSGPEIDDDEKVVDFSFITDVFGKVLQPSLDNPSRQAVMSRLSEPALAADTDTALEPGTVLLQRVAGYLAPIKIAPKTDIPGFIVTVSREMSIDFIFQDQDLSPLNQFEGATVQLGDRTAIIEKGRATIKYSDIKSLYLDLSALDEIMFIKWPDGKTVSRFLPEGK